MSAFSRRPPLYNPEFTSNRFCGEEFLSASLYSGPINCKNSKAKIIGFLKSLKEFPVRKAYVFAFLFLTVISVLADQVTLKNGDRLTGSITKSDDQTLVIKTDYAGEVTVKFDAIQDITSTAT